MVPLFCGRSSTNRKANQKSLKLADDEEERLDEREREAFVVVVIVVVRSARSGKKLEEEFAFSK